ncbi:hypothetical protein [Pseudobacter ginsenosidimutans]|uniref:hypothetical protein n=1 Tax=Pseudobacter ginsenosidimutans TaxID=661488 RepID=UPI00102D8DBF|nr:hypothetical protein [Pseudobacter ginsenosidimutans]
METQWDPILSATASGIPAASELSDTIKNLNFKEDCIYFVFQSTFQFITKARHHEDFKKEIRHRIPRFGVCISIHHQFNLGK